MQRVIHAYKNQSRIFNMLEGLYTYVSDSEYMFDDILWLDNSFSALNEILQSYILIYREPLLKEFDLPRVPVNRNDPKEITVCLSGGKDSAAAAFYYKQMGYKVHLYHATGVNKAYGDEKLAAQRIADYLGYDLFIDKIRLEGTHRFIEHPLKNYVIANGAIHYCLAMGYTPQICFGNFNQAHVDLNAFEVCGGDCIEMWNAYQKIMQSAIPEFNIEIPLKTNTDTFDILEKDWTLFELSVSCMSPFRFRAFWKHRCEEQYNIRLFENRCGVCWKCALEAAWLMDTDRMDYNEAYYLHCFGILASTIFKEARRKEEYLNVWHNYMFYPITHSKAYDIISDCTLKYLPNNSVQIIYQGERRDAPI